MIQITPKEIQLIEVTTKSISISNERCNNDDYILFNFSRFRLVEEIIIGDNCFENVEQFKIDGLNRLKSLKIGTNSFTKKKNGATNDKSRSFSISNCGELKSIEIGSFSFSDYGDGFELKNLPKLESIIIGLVGNDSFNFYYSSFVIKGKQLMYLLLMNRSSQFEFH